MINIIQKKREFIGKRVKEIRDKLGLTHPAFAKGCGLSTGTIVTIESGKKGYIIDSLLSVLYFLGIELEEFADPSFKILSRDKLKQTIIDFHKQHKSLAFQVLDEKPRLSNVLKERLLTTNFLLQPKQVGEIVSFCKDEYNIIFRSSSVTNAMNKLIKEGLIKRISSGRKGVFLYKKIIRKR